MGALVGPDGGPQPHITQSLVAGYMSRAVEVERDLPGTGTEQLLEYYTQQGDCPSTIRRSLRTRDAAERWLSSSPCVSRRAGPSPHCAGIRILLAQQGPWPNDVPASILEPPCNAHGGVGALVGPDGGPQPHITQPCCRLHVVRSGVRKRPAWDWDRTTCCGADVPCLLCTALESRFWWLSKDRGPMTCQLPFSSPHAMHMAAWARLLAQMEACSGT